MAARPDLRVGDADREAVAAELREHFALGRLSLEEFNHRLDAAFTATTESQLRRITSDLPHAMPQSVPLPIAAGRPGADGAWGARERGHGPRFVGTLVAIMATWLFVFSYLLPHLRFFPVPGKLALLVIVFGLVRGLFRRVFGRARFRGPCGYSRGWDSSRDSGGPRGPGGPWPGR
ncbi:MAG: DUF1707 domain-containing protein [Streptosporangiaceae bacterium]|jgi:hypothetical protein|nr:hypothetical protein [Actinomycetota bacterium]